MLDRRSIRIECQEHREGGAPLAEYKSGEGGDDHYYIFYPGYFEAPAPLARAHTVIHEAIHHVTGNSGDLYTDQISARALPHLTGLPLERNQDTIAGFIIAAARGTQQGIEATSHEYTYRPDASVPSEVAHKLQVVGELVRWILVQARSFLNGQIELREGPSLTTVNALTVELARSAEPYAKSDLRASKRYADAAVRMPSKYGEQELEDTHKAMKAREQEVTTLQWWQGNAAGILAGTVAVPSRHLAPTPALVVLDKWAYAATREVRFQADRPGFAGHLTARALAVLGAVELPIPFSEVGAPGTAVSAAVTFMLRERLDVPEAVAALILRLFKMQPFKPFSALPDRL